MPQPLLSAASILAASDLVEETVEVPEWPNEDGTPGRIRFLQMTADENIQWTKDMADEAIGGPAGENGMFLMVVYSAVDADGKRLFTLEDIIRLRAKSFHVIHRLQQVAMRLNQMSSQAREELGKVLAEEATEGSPTD